MTREEFTIKKIYSAAERRTNSHLIDTINDLMCRDVNFNIEKGLQDLSDTSDIIITVHATIVGAAIDWEGEYETPD